MTTVSAGAPRFSGIELAGPEPPSTRSFLRGVGHLPLQVTPC
jgi:hypothetical protein